MSDSKRERSKPPEISPYALPVVLAAMGAWCFYDGWFSLKPGIQEHLTFNRVMSAILLIGAVFSFLRVRRGEKSNIVDRTEKKAPHDDN